MPTSRKWTTAGRDDDPRQQSRRSAWRPIVFCGMMLTMAFASGCGGKDRLPVAPVQGRVIYQGQGVPNATVVFFPVGDAAERVGKMRPFADTDGEGRFTLKTYVAGDGVPPGDYQVCVVILAGGDRRGGERKDASDDDEASATPRPNVLLSIRKKYASVETSGITLTIHEGENNLDPFVLE
jgi:hypothetical protein